MAPITLCLWVRSVYRAQGGQCVKTVPVLCLAWTVGRTPRDVKGVGVQTRDVWGVNHLISRENFPGVPRPARTASRWMSRVGIVLQMDSWHLTLGDDDHFNFKITTLFVELVGKSDIKWQIDSRIGAPNCRGKTCLSLQGCQGCQLSTPRRPKPPTTWAVPQGSSCLARLNDGSIPFWLLSLLNSL